MFAYFQGKLKIFQSYAQYRREKGGMTNKTYRSSATKSRPPRGKKAIRKRVSADAFSLRAFLSLRVFLFRPFERLRFGLFLGVSLSAAARSAAALVYDKLTPNCHPILERYMKNRQTSLWWLPLWLY